jgi:hypothetical protein
LSSITLAPCFALDFGLQPADLHVPEHIQELSQSLKAFGPDAVKPLGTRATLVQQPGMFENA